ncbi:hypothetical protein [Brevundimonas sp.]|uniref:hypothetical protein n=1 Tax=Brevundimonas sp. TaxID=1871086 RepID=UPI0027319227|nr:hypothetical protein [Brevundimonas sp.]MDP1912861.1 hypothetical protein [Brevundimonas sp.]
MRPLTPAAPLVLLLVLAGCAPTMGSSRYAEELRQLSESCTARGGILVPTDENSGRPPADHVCRITGGATRLPSGG